MQFGNLQTSVSHFRVYISASISVRITFNSEDPCLFVDKINSPVEWFDFDSRQVWNLSAGHHFTGISFRFQSGKGKAVPLQAWRGPEGSRKLRFPDFTTTAQKGGKVVSLTEPTAFTPRKSSWYSFPLEAESTPGP